jgi:xanthine dehydrogenase iron-sulfur cluster and FAD-binding subunit A
MFDRVEAFYRPASVREALRLLHCGNGRARIVAGGTDIAVHADDSIRFLIDGRAIFGTHPRDRALSRSRPQ